MDTIPDVSNYQGSVDWGAVIRSGRIGGICKATEGLTYVDPTFATNWDRLGQLNAVRGAYHFARPDKAVPESQADKFLTIVKSTKPADILVLDIEVGTGDLSGWAMTFLTRVQAKTGIKPWLYSYAPFIRAHLQGEGLAQFPLWLAAYQATPPLTPHPWLSWQLWQHTDKASIPGIRGTCDESMGNITAISPAPAPSQGVPVDNVNRPPVKMLSHPAWNGGYLVVTDDGGVFSYGAPFFGSAGGTPLNKPIIDAEVTPTGQGYWLMGGDGGIFAFGDATMKGRVAFSG